jgi:hypothetical protein
MMCGQKISGKIFWEKIPLFNGWLNGLSGNND